MHGKAFNADKANNSNRKSHSLPQSLNGDYKNSSRNLLTRQPNTLNKIENRTRAIVTSKPMFLSRKSEDSYSVNNNNLVFNSQPTFSVLEQSNQEFFGNPIASNSPKSFPSGKPVRIIPIGGVNEVGMNMTVLEYDDEMIVIDTGMGFGGGEKFPGVDYVIPDTSYIEQNRHKLKGIIYTHGHLDHIGGAPYILPKLGNVPIFGLPLTLGLLKNRLAEFELQDNYIMKVVELNRSLKLGNFTIHFFRLNHSIPDNFGMAIDTPMGRVLYCTDWKFDNTPFDGQLSDYAKLGRFGDEGVRLLMTDTLGALRPGYSMSEKVIGETINQIFAKAEGRILFTTFASTVARLQHVVNACILYNRKLVLLGRSMISTFNTAYELGKIKVPKGLVIEVNQINDLPPEKVAILLTGSQGEDNAALNRIARDEHPQIKLQGGDTVIFSSSAIPGNEESVQDLMSRIAKKGVEVLNHKEFDIHTSGHAAVEDIKMMLALTRPEYVQPIHGEYFMHQKLANIAVSMGMDRNNILIGENGQIVEMRSDKVVLTDNRVTDSYVLVDGSGIGSVSQVVLEERKTMSSQGVIIVVLLINKQKRLVGGPETISRGFVYMKNNQELFQQLEQLIRQKFNSLLIDPKSTTYFSELRTNLKQIIGDFIYEKTEKNPMIIPVVVQV
jgi:ribonuclease J